MSIPFKPFPKLPPTSLDAASETFEHLLKSLHLSDSDALTKMKLRRVFDEGRVFQMEQVACRRAEVSFLPPQHKRD